VIHHDFSPFWGGKGKTPILILPLFKIAAAAPEQSVLLDQVVWLVFDNCLSWQSMSRLSCDTAGEVEHLEEGQYLSIAASKSGHALPAISKISKKLVTYMVGLVAVSPYKHGQFYSCAKGVAENASAEALKWLNKLKNEP
jgi:hypothetical protein